MQDNNPVSNQNASDSSNQAGQSLNSPIPVNPSNNQIQQPPNPQIAQPVTISPEVGPVGDKQVETTPAKVEYGYDALQKIEQAREVVKPAEKQESTPKPKPPTIPVQKQQPKQELKPKPVLPKFFGYNIPMQIANNFDFIKKFKGKGDPKKARTWILMLLDRLLKKQVYNPE